MISIKAIGYMIGSLALVGATFAAENAQHKRLGPIHAKYAVLYGLLDTCGALDEMRRVDRPGIPTENWNYLANQTLGIASYSGERTFTAGAKTPLGYFAYQANSTQPKAGFSLMYHPNADASPEQRSTIIQTLAGVEFAEVSDNPSTPTCEKLSRHEPITIGSDAWTFGNQYHLTRAKS